MKTKCKSSCPSKLPIHHIYAELTFKSRILLLACIALLLTGKISAQTTFHKVFGGMASNEDLDAVVQTSDGSIFAAGFTYSFGAGDADLVVFKTDNTGSILWTKTYGGTNTDWGNDLIETRDGHIVVTGMSRSYGMGNHNVYLLKLDQDGNVIWSMTYGGLGTQMGYSVVETSDGGFAIAGYTRSFGAGFGDTYVIKTDNLGNPVWSRTFGGPGHDEAMAIMETSTGHFVLTGFSESFGAGGSDVYLVKMDNLGNLIWSRTFGGFTRDAGNDLLESSDGNYVVTGYTGSYGAGNEDIYLLKVDPNGTLIWNKTYGGANYDAGHSIIETTSGDLIISGRIASYGAGFNDAFLMKTTDKGNFIWAKAYGGASGELGLALFESSAGGFIVSGATTSWDADPGNNGGVEFYLFKTDREGNTGCNEVDFIPEIGSGVTIGSGAVVNSGVMVSSGFTITDAHPEVLTLCLDCTQDWSNSFDNSNQHDRGFGIDYTHLRRLNPGYIVTGTTTPKPLGIPLDPGESHDIFLLRTDRFGSELWRQLIATPFNEHGRDVEETSDLGMIICGYTDDTPDGSENALLVRTDASGNTQWTRSYGSLIGPPGGLQERAHRTTQTADDGYAFTGIAERTSPIGRHLEIYTVRTNQSGNVLWNRVIDGGFQGDDHGQDIFETAKGKRIGVVGYSEGGKGNDFSHLILLDKDNGSTIWHREYFGFFDYQANAGIQTFPDGGFMLTGRKRHPKNNGSQVVTPDEIFVLKTNTEGIEKWRRHYALPAPARRGDAFDIVQKGDGGYAISGEIHWMDKSNDMFLLEIDENGVEECFLIVGQANKQGENFTGRSLVPALGSDAFVLAGTGFDPGNTFQDMQIVQAKCCADPGRGGKRKKSEDAEVDNVAGTGIRIYPNPATDRLYIKINTHLHPDLSLALYHNNGQLVRSRSLSHHGLDIADLPAGLYILQVSSADGLLEHFKVVKY